jgi:hypothetical protein
MPAAGVQHVPNGLLASYDWADGTVRLCHSPTWMWPAPSADTGRDNLDADEWDRVTDALVASARRSAELSSEQVLLALTGGKDSRLCAAVASAAGLSDNVVAFTAGRPGHPDAQIGGQVADAVRFRHEVGALGPRRLSNLRHGAEPLPAAEQEWRRLRRHIDRYEGIVNAWSGRDDWADPGAVILEGFLGEFYRGGHAEQFRVSRPVTVKGYQDRFLSYHQRPDPGRVLTSGIRRYQDDWIRSWVTQNAEVVRLDLLPEKFDLDFRQAHWTGPLIQCADFTVVNPLMTKFAATKLLELSPEARMADTFLREVLTRAAPELLKIPLLDDQWAYQRAEMMSGSAAPEPTAAPTPRRGLGRRRAVEANRSETKPRDDQAVPQKHTLRSKTAARAAWSFLVSDSDLIGTLFDDASRSTDFDRICDPVKAKHLAQRSADLTRLPEIRALYGCIGVAMTMLDQRESTSAGFAD